MTINIVGKHGVGHPDCPPLEWALDGEWWGLNHITPEDDENLGRYDRWFHLHTDAHMRRFAPEQWDDHRQFWSSAREVGRQLPLLYQCEQDTLTGAEAFPAEQVQSLIGNVKRGRYHCSSADWLVAYAIYRGVNTIRIHRFAPTCGPAYLREPLAARPCLEFWCGFAEGRGIRVEVATGSELFAAVHMARVTSLQRYGFDREPTMEMQEIDGKPTGFSDWRY